MAAAGLAADLIDRKKLIIWANCAIAFVVILILLTLDKVFASIFLSFLYFAGNTFFFPAISAASAQIVQKSQLPLANSVFIFTLAGGQLSGLFLGSISLFLFGHKVTLVICEFLLITAIVIPLFLPKLLPRKLDGMTIMDKIMDISRAFIYIFKAKVIWFFFLTFAAMQGVVAFGATLGPGYFDEVVKLSIDKSPIFIFPPIAVGVILGAFFVYKPKIRQSFFVAVGLGTLGFTSAILGIIIKSSLIAGIYLLIPSSIFLIFAGFGTIIAMIASRTALQQKVAHNYLGTVFGANIVLAAFGASVMSPAAATFELLIGYVNVLVFGGLVFLVVSAGIGIIGKRWNF
jgi:MFS family permease